MNHPSDLLKGIEAITFDAAGTLIVPHPSVGEVYAETAKSFGYSLEPEILENRFRHVFKALKAENPAALLDQVRWKQIVFQTFSGLTAEADMEPIFRELWRSFSSPDRWKILPGIVDTLSKLQSRGLPIYLFSNNDERLHSVLEGIGLAKYFHAVFLSVELGAEKPAQEAFSQVEIAINQPAGSILHVGDSPYEDIQGANQAGWRSALVGPKGARQSPPLPDFSAQNVPELFLFFVEQK
ncbi:MAG: HAD-IA family hydrolase [Verrucomicrobiota bacterium]